VEGLGCHVYNKPNDLKLGVPHDQIGSTCWANATASAIRAAEKQKGGKVRGHPELVDYLVNKYGDKGQKTFNILKEECELLGGLECIKVSEKDAKIAISEGSIVVISFGMDHVQRTNFHEFFNENDKDAVFTKDMMKEDDSFAAELLPKGSLRTLLGSRMHGHAVCAIGYNSKKKAWLIQNSWGGDYKNGGYCFVKEGVFSSLRHNTFIDILIDKKVLVQPPKEDVDEAQSTNASDFVVFESKPLKNDPPKNKLDFF